jgi:replicative DNA helicase
MSEIRLPHSLEAEQSLLGALLVDCESASGVFQIVVAADFYSPRHARIFAALQELFDRHSTVDEVMLKEELARRNELDAAGGLDYFYELIQRLPTAANAEYYARIVADKAVLRGLVGACGEIIQGVMDSSLPAREQQDIAEQRIFEISQKGSGTDFVPILEVIDEQFERFDGTHADEGAVFSGFADLDQVTNGFHPAELIIVAGRPSMGKTSFCLNVVEHAALAGKKVGIFSLEVSRDQVVTNLLCTHAKIDAHRLRKRSLGPKEWTQLTEAANVLRDTAIYIDDTPGLSPLALKSRARRLHKRYGVDLVIVDYLQLMEDRSFDSRQEEISCASRSLKGLARELNLPVIAVSQLSRGVENRENHKPRLSDLRESGAIEQDADLVLLLYREEYYKPDKEEAKGKAEVIIAKQRNGPTGSVSLCFLSHYMRFENLDLRHQPEEAVF